MSIKDGPLLDEWNKDNEGVVLKELITYRFIDGVLHKEKVSRSFRNKNDYHDTRSAKPFIEL